MFHHVPAGFGDGGDQPGNAPRLTFEVLRLPGLEDDVPAQRSNKWQQQQLPELQIERERQMCHLPAPFLVASA
jgi:hypothetical protein